jgi:type I restriction enzyme S subunit
MAGEWKTVQLRDACIKIGSGATPTGGKEAYRGGATALIRSQNIYNDGFHRDGLAYIDDDQSAELRNVEVKSNDVLLNITGDSVARCCLVASDVLPARVNQHVAIIRPKPDSLDARFLRYVLVSHEYQQRLLALASAGATRPALTKMMIEELSIPSPPLAEQKAIAAVLGALDDKIELNRRMNATLEGIARALFQSWFIDFDPVRRNIDRRGQKSEIQKEKSESDSSSAISNFNLHPSLSASPATDALFPDSFQESELGQIPAGWEVKPLAEVIELAYGKPLKAEDRKNGPVCVYGANGPVGWHDEKLVSGPGIVVGRKGNPGVVTWAPGDFYPIDTTFYVVPIADCTSLYFLYYALSLHNLANLSADSAVPGLNRNHAYMSKQVIPSPEVLKAFDAQIAPLFAAIDANEDQSRTLATLRDTLLPKLLSGELSVAGNELLK